MAFNWNKLMDLRMIYLIATAAILIGCMFPFSVIVPAAEYSKAVYDAVESIEPGDIALIVSWVGPYDDTWAARDIVTRHIIQKGGHLIWYSEGAGLIPYLLDEMDNLYGEDWVNSPDYGETFAYFGFIPLSALTLSNIAKDASLVFVQDAFGTPVSELPIMDDFKDGNDVKLILGFPGAWRSIAAWYGQFETYYLHVENMGGLVGRIDSYRTGTLTGIVGGAVGTSQYAQLSGLEPAASNWKFMTPMLYLAILGTIGFIAPNLYIAIKGKQEEEK